MISLKNKVAIVTGASSGIGAELSRELSTAGALVSLTARRKEKLDAAARNCPGSTLALVADLTCDRDRTRIVEQTLAKWGQIDILINNAGLGAYGSFEASSAEQWREIFEINLFAPVDFTRQVLPFMKAQGQGIIVNMASIGGLAAHSDKVAPYVSSKHAIVGFTRALARDLSGTGIRTLAVCPHLTDTEFFTTSQGAEEMASEIGKLRKFLDSPVDVARGILEQLDSDALIVFPTDKPARAYEKLKEI